MTTGLTGGRLALNCELNGDWMAESRTVGCISSATEQMDYFKKMYLLVECSVPLSIWNGRPRYF